MECPNSFYCYSTKTKPFLNQNKMSNNLFEISSELQDIILQLEEGEATDELIEKLKSQKII